MAFEGETKPCVFSRCPSRMKYSNTSRPPGNSVGTGDDFGNIIWQQNEQPGWRCSSGHWVPEPDLSQPVIGSKRFYGDDRAAELLDGPSGVIEAWKLSGGWTSLTPSIGRDMGDAQRMMDYKMGVEHDPSQWFPVTRTDEDA